MFGWFSSLGLGLVANFQETNLEGVHMTGVAMKIGFGILYMYLQTFISCKMSDTVTLSRVRLAMSISCTITAASCGYQAHMTAAISEWLTCIVFLLYFATFVQDFKRISASVTFHII
ncbi:DNA damage-regulated autophagy modulator protein 1-like [Saccostrea echinata]|uniref:DNA damage-regulated autophagy modulator protein 1-like n=1 Tax=Saccostrea echinata TaxID=191078 RepID=UPI002A82272F|nr:DNA damage-regulated autophagy modulator protein 1-like [Saccostrea echinata]